MSSDTGFDSYLKSEYDHIAEAHFRTIDTITAFFRYYLLIMSIPISLIAAFSAVAQQNNFSLEILGGYTPIVAAIFIIISVAGFGVLLYLISLRMDAILYARQVNAIRKHFYDSVPSYVMDLDLKTRKRVLPQTASQPGYLEWRYFGPVVWVIATFNAFYLFGSTALIVALISGNADWQTVLAWALPISLVFWLSHLLAYWRYARYREHSYLKSYILGVDICGVLNEHRPRFCEVLCKTEGNVIDPEDITIVPVHEHPTLGITREDEKRVFNEPEYWTEMNPTNSSVDRLRSIRNAFKIKVILFTHRPWPNIVDMKTEEKIQILDKWEKAVDDYFQRGLEEGKLSEVRLCKNPIYWIRMKIGVTTAKDYYEKGFKKGKFSEVRLCKNPVYWIRMKIGVTPIEQITRNWLEYHKYAYDKLIIEKGSDDISDPQGHFKNRFYISRQKKIKFFVEDIVEKAEKLAHICDVVFLFDHPYNRNQGTKLPTNIVRVESWDDIYKEIRKLS